jgi:predicted permease
MRSLLADIRFSLRMLGKDLGFTTVLVITLALGIGASTTIFSVVNSVLLKPLPYPQADRLVRVYTEFHAGTMHLERFWVSTPEYFDVAGVNRSFDSIGAWALGTASFSGGDRPVRVPAAYATASMLETLGVQPAMGRLYGAEEDPPKADPQVAIIGHNLWKRAFGGDPAIVGRRILVDAMPVQIIGVMPAGFDFPGAGVEAWLPIGLDPANQQRGGHYLHVVARLADGVNLAQARGEMDALIAAWSEGKTPDGGPHHIRSGQHPMLIHPLKGEVVGSLASTLWLLQGAVLFVLLIAIANIANLLLARAESRAREIAVRHALGATRARLVRQFLTESLVLGIIGGGLGILVAVWALDATIALIPASAPRLGEIALDGASLAFAVACTVSASVLFGLAPILHTRVKDLPATLKEGSQRTTGTRARLRLRRGLVIAEVALAVVLVISCGLMVRSFIRLQQVDLGYQPDHVLTFEVEVPKKNYPEPANVIQFHQRLQERLRGLPGVRQATLMTGALPVRRLLANDIAFPGRARTETGPNWNVDYWQVVGDDYLETLGGRLVRGRALRSSDTADTPFVVMVNEAFVRKFYPDEDPIGKLIQVTSDEKSVPQTIVGVVADQKQAGVDRPAGTEVFFNLWQDAAISGGPSLIVTAVLRTEGEPGALAPAAQRVLADLDPTLPMSNLRTLDDVLWEAVARPRFLTFLLGVFAVLALLLAAVGIYGVMSYTVAQRTHEIGIRMALGAAPARVRGMVLRQAALIAAIGVGVGLLAAVALDLALERALSRLMFGVQSLDPLVYGGVGVLVVLAALLASWVPARRATRVEPTIALRAE